LFKLGDTSGDAGCRGGLYEEELPGGPPVGWATEGPAKVVGRVEEAEKVVARPKPTAGGVADVTE
jgi:hypothetical protein